MTATWPLPPFATGHTITATEYENYFKDTLNLLEVRTGIWAPVLGGSGGTAGQTYDANDGTYTRIGRVVFAQFRITLIAKGAITGDVQIQGLPFASAGSYFSANPVVFSAMATNFVSLVLLVRPGTTVAELQGTTAAAMSMSTLTTANIGQTTDLIGTLVYEAAP